MKLVRPRGEATIRLAGLSEDRPPHDQLVIRGLRELDGGGPGDLSLVLVQLDFQRWVLDDLGRPRRRERSGDAHHRRLGHCDPRREERARLRLGVDVEAIRDVGRDGKLPSSIQCSGQRRGDSDDRWRVVGLGGPEPRAGEGQYEGESQESKGRSHGKATFLWNNRTGSISESPPADERPALAPVHSPRWGQGHFWTISSVGSIHVKRPCCLIMRPLTRTCSPA